MLPKDYVAYRLSGVFATDCSDAAGTLYFDTKNRRWSGTMLSVLGIGEKNLPKVYESYQAVGTLKKSVADELGLNENVKSLLARAIMRHPQSERIQLKAGTATFRSEPRARFSLQATSSIMCRTAPYIHFAPRRANIIISRVFCRRQAAKNGGLKA